MSLPSVISSLIGRCGSCGRRISLAGCPDHGIPNLESGVSDGDAFPDESESIAPAFPGYQVEQILGRGGFGTVYRARCTDGKLVAIKQSRAEIPESAIRLLREAEVMSVVRPPHVPAIIEHGAFADGSQFMVMELVGVPSLADYLLQQRTRTVSESFAIASAVLRPLAAVHACGYIHRDLKPENILYDAQRNRAVLIDFGLSRADGGQPNNALDELTIEGTLVGTTDYMAPEQHEGRLDLDASADIYAMGIILFELLTERVPFFGPAALVREAHRSQRPPSLSSWMVRISSALEEIVLRCLAKSPSDRYPNAAALAAALEETNRTVSVSEAVPSPLDHADLPPSRRGSRPRTELRMVSILNFTSPLDGIALRRYFEPKGAQIVHTSKDRHVIAFGHTIDANPARRALFVARDLLAEGRARSIMLDIKQVSVRWSPNGGYRISAPHLAREARFPESADPNEIVFSDSARTILEASDSAIDAPASSPHWTSPTRSSVTPPPPAAILFGRDALLNAIVSAANHVVDAALPTTVIVVGESGYGKSQIRRVLATRLQAAVPHATIVNLQAQAPTDGSSGGSLREFLQHALGLPASVPNGMGPLWLESRLGAETNPAAIAAIALAIGWITPGAEVHGESNVTMPLAALEAAPGAIRMQLTIAAAKALRLRAREAPLFILLDDAHFADDATIAILEHATRGDESVPIFVCTLGRPTFTDVHPTFGSRAGHHELHVVGALDAASASNLCQHLLRPAENVPASAIERIVERAQAIPLLLVELVRGIKAAGIVRPNSTGAGCYLATDELDKLPELPLIEWLVHRELDALPEGARAHARLAAVLGMEVTNAELEGVHKRLDRAGLGDEFPLDARIGSERLVERGLFVRVGHDRYRFRHSLLREAIARTVAEELRPNLHRAAIDHWQTVDVRSDSTSLAKLAHHAARAGNKRLAETASLALAESARARHDYLEAERYYSEALEHAAHPDRDAARRRNGLRGRALMRYRLGRYADARIDLAAARKSAEIAGDALADAEILLDEATVLDWMSDHSASASCVDEAFDKVSSLDVAPLLEARLLLGRGRSLHRASREEQARIKLERVLAIVDDLGEEAYETRVIALLMSSFILQGLARLEDAARALDRAVALCETHGDLLHLASAVNNRALLNACLGNKPTMVKDLERVISLGRQLGQDAIQIGGHYNLGEYLYLWGDIDAATPHAQHALQLESSRTGNSPRVEVELLPARLLLHHGDLAAARDIVAHIRTRKRTAMPAPAIDVLCTMVEYACTSANDAAWDALEAQSTQFSIGQERIEVIEARAVAALRNGRPEEARKHFIRAIDASHAIPNVMRERLERRLAG